MRAVVQRVTQAQVRVAGSVTAKISAGLVVLLGVRREDTSESAGYLAQKIANLRIFRGDAAPDAAEEAGKMSRSILEVGGSALIVPQFTLYADTREGRRPSYVQAARPEDAKRLYEEFVACLRSLGIAVETGVFQAHMEVELVNDGPVTILLDSEKTI